MPGRSCTRSPSQGQLRKASDKRKKKGELSIADTIKLLRQRGMDVTADGTTVKPWYMIDPRTSLHVAKWDATLAFALCLTALVTPYEIAFLSPPLSADPVFWFNRVVDAIFMCDMILVCYTITPVHSVIEGTKWIAKPSTLFARYVHSGWFFIDLIALTTSGFDVVVLFSRDAGYLRRLKVPLPPCTTPRLPATHALSQRSRVASQVLRILRVLKLMRLAKLLSASRLLQHWETQLLVNYGVIKLTKAFVMILVYCHWFACLWALQAQLGKSIADIPFARSWMADDGYCILLRDLLGESNVSVVPPTAYAQPSWIIDNHDSYLHGQWFESPEGWPSKLTEEQARDPPDDGLWVCVSGWKLYAASIYFSSMVITSIGLGDISATARNHFEMMCATFIMLVSGVMWSQVLATMTQVLATMAPADTEFHITMDDLNRFMKGYELPLDMQLRLREYFHRTKHLQMSGANRGLLLKMSPKLQGEILLHCNSSWLGRVSFLQKVDTEFIAALVLRLAPIVFAPGDTIFGTSLYIVHRGLALYGGKLLTHGMVWGEDMLLEAPHLRSTFCARALNYLEVYMVSRDELMEIAAHFPDTYRKIRMYVCKLALRRMIVLMTRDKHHLLELRRKFPDTLGMLLDKLYGDEMQKLQDAKAAGDFGGWAQPQSTAVAVLPGGPDEAALVSSSPRVAPELSLKEVREKRRFDESRPTKGAIHFGAAHSSSDLGLTEVITSGWHGTSGRVAYTAPLGLQSSFPTKDVPVATAPAAVTQKRKPSSANKSHPGRAVEGCAVASPPSSPKAVAAAGQAPLRQKSHKKTNNLAQEARIKTMLDAGLAPLQAELAAIRQRMDAQHAEVMRALNGAADRAAVGGARQASTASSGQHRRVVRTTTHEEMELSA